MSRVEPMKQRFKKKFAYKMLDEMHFDDDRDDFGKSYKEIKRKLHHKSRGQARGRKPQWRDERKQLRKFKWGE
jgi:hypothetical protein